MPGAAQRLLLWKRFPCSPGDTDCSRSITGVLRDYSPQAKQTGSKAERERSFPLALGLGRRMTCGIPGPWRPRQSVSEAM